MDTPLSIKNRHGTFYYQRDHQGSILALTDEQGNTVESFEYDNSYGAIIKHTTTEGMDTQNPFGYTGREMDRQDLYYYRARYYDPQVQVFLSVDPSRFVSGDFNFYRYVENSPLIYIDPFGLNKKIPSKEECAAARSKKRNLDSLHKKNNQIDKNRRKASLQNEKMGMSTEDATSEAKKSMKSLAALHNPDMMVAGKDIITGFGDRGVNSSIGRQWRDRVSEMDDMACKAQQQGKGADKMNVKLERCKKKGKSNEKTK